MHSKTAGTKFIALTRFREIKESPTFVIFGVADPDDWK